MKIKFIIPTLLLAFLSLFCGCDAMNAGSLKTLTHPYINEYQCTKAILGEKDLLTDYEYITINILNDKKLLITSKPKNGEKITINGEYEVNEDSGEIICKSSFLGAEIKERVFIKKGKFTISKIIAEKPLILIFESKN